MKNYQILILLFLLLSSCDTIVDIDMEKEAPKLVLNSFFNPDSTFTTDLYKSQFVLDENSHERISDAVIRIMDEDGNKLTDLMSQGDGKYISDLKPLAGKVYQIQAAKDGYETVTATDIIPAEPAIVSDIEVTKYIRDGGPDNNKISFTIEDKPGEDFYELFVTVGYFFQSDFISSQEYSTQYLFSNDPVFSEDNLNSRYLLFNDALFDGKKRNISFETSFQYPRCDNCILDLEILLNIRKLSKQYYDYRRTLDLQRSLNDDPLAEPVSVYNNINNGYGIFAGFQTSSFVLEKPDEEKE